MPINIKGKPKAPETTNNQADLDTVGEAGTEQSTSPASTANTPPTQQNVKAPGHQSGASFLIQGDQQRSAVDQVKAVQDLRSKLRGGAREFWLNPGEFAKLYFLDGKLLADGVFDTPMVNLHMLQIGGSWAKFVCNIHTEGDCVVCNSNADGTQPMTQQLFTAINVMPYVIQGGPNKGKTMPARLQLFTATMKVREKLMKRAQTRGGSLAGSLYQFSRASKQDPRTGDDIEFIQEVPMQGVLQKYPMLHTVYDEKTKTRKDAPTTVYDYATVFPVVTNAEIASLRPDIASMAGFTAYTPMPAGPASGFGADPSAGLDDEIPF